MIWRSLLAFAFLALPTTALAQNLTQEASDFSAQDFSPRLNEVDRFHLHPLRIVRLDTIFLILLLLHAYPTHCRPKRIQESLTETPARSLPSMARKCGLRGDTREERYPMPAKSRIADCRVEERLQTLEATIANAKWMKERE